MRITNSAMGIFSSFCPLCSNQVKPVRKNNIHSQRKGKSPTLQQTHQENLLQQSPMQNIYMKKKVPVALSIKVILPACISCNQQGMLLMKSSKHFKHVHSCSYFSQSLSCVKSYFMTKHCPI